LSHGSVASPLMIESVERFAIRSGGRILFVKPDEIDWIRSADNYCELHVGDAAHLMRGTLAGLEQQLPQGKFVRVSRSHMVNVGRIQEIHPQSSGDCLIVLSGGKKSA